MAREQRFRCTACGKCCFGILPLTLADALAGADRFPLALLITPVGAAERKSDLARSLEVSVPLDRRRGLSVRGMVAAYLPARLPCPALSADGLCGVHDDKPLRCRTMPFDPYADEARQAPYLIPRPGWACDRSETAPVVYRDGRIVERQAFEREREALQADAPLVTRQVKAVLASSPSVVAGLVRAAGQKTPSHVAINFSSLLARLPEVDGRHFAARQIPVLRAYQERTAGQAEFAAFHASYRDWAIELESRL
ncbi:MAG: YkgJ family cysteine cluster protein [Rhodospirillales bacterium]|nr:YkgJ family cysteine cluster protein [Rhodospirillales bacterium]